jgi:hypothetical protein
MKAIITKYLPFTSTRPSRIIAKAEGVPSKTYTCEGLNDPLFDKHQVVARKFAAENNWPLDLVSGGLPDGSWAHCFLPERVKFELEQLKADVAFAQEQAALQAAKLGEAPLPPPPPKSFTVVAVSSNTNSFGYKGVLFLAEDGTGYEVAFQAYGADPLPKQGDVIPEDRLPRSPSFRVLPVVPPEKARKIIAEAKGGAK